MRFALLTPGTRPYVDLNIRPNCRRPHPSVFVQIAQAASAVHTADVRQSQGPSRCGLHLGSCIRLSVSAPIETPIPFGNTSGCPSVSLVDFRTSSNGPDTWYLIERLTCIWRFMYAWCQVDCSAS